MSRTGASGLRSEINVTPLVDVVLVLLIVFMVIVPATMRGYDVDVPGKPDGSQPTEAGRDQIVLAIDADDCPLIVPPESPGLPGDCRVRLADTVFPVAELGRRTAKIFAFRAQTNRVLFLAADDQLNYEGVMRILDAAQEGVAGLRIGIVTMQDRDA